MTKVSKMVLSLSVAASGAFCAVALAGESTISVEGLISPTDASTTLNVTTVKTTGAFPLPEQDQPAFWFDCSQRMGWEYDANGKVVKIPSLVGTRYLSCKAADLVTWAGWAKGATPPLPPTLVTGDAMLAQGAYLDFGSLGSKNALVFNAVGTAPTNNYQNIGTVIAVWGSQRGGGFLLGGGSKTVTGYNETSGALDWRRGGSWSKSTGTYTETVAYDSPVIGYDYSATATREGIVRHDGLPTVPYYTGFNHGWEVVSLTARNATTLATATGLGIGDGRSSVARLSGGMNVAELMIFERLLTAAELAKVETWLQQKWFGRMIEGVDGAARVSRIFPRNGSTETATVETVVPAGETLAVGSLEGGRGRNSALVKSGAGTLTLKDATGFAADVNVQGGTLSLAEKRPIPALSDLSDLYLHFDATDVSSLIIETRDEVEYVSYWKDLLGGTIWSKRGFFGQTDTAKQPKLLRNAVGTGKHMIDFGTLAAPAWMRVMNGTLNTDGSIASSTAKNMGGVSTIIAVMGVQNGGGRITLVDLPACQRATTDYNAATYSAQLPILNAKLIDKTRNISATNGTVWVNGLKVGPTEGYGTPGYVVVALRVPTSEHLAYLAAGLNGNNAVDYAGGFRVGEMFLYNRLLGDREVEDVSAYLMNRWFGREAPGYAKTPARIALDDVQRVVASAGTRVDVATNVTANITALSAAEGVAKTGAGTLAVSSLTAGTLSLEGGAVRMVNAPTVATSQLAAAPCLHLDAADATTFELVAENGTNFVKRWYSKDRLNAAYLTYGTYLYRPWLNAEKSVAGTALVDFGNYGSQGRYLVLEKALYSMREVFVILDGEKGGGLLFSGRGGVTNKSTDECPNYKHSMSGEPMDYFTDIWTSPFALVAPTMSPMVAGGELFTNGVSVTAACKFPKNAALIEYHPLAATGGYMIGCTKAHENRGGFRLGEMIVYDRKLTTRERVATRNYLMAKWFGAEPEDLPDEESTSTVGALAGQGGTLEKQDAGTLNVGNLNGFTGTVSVAAGALAFTQVLPAVEPKLTTEGRLVHFDASDAASMTLVDKGTYTGVSEWRSQVNGWKAAAISKYFSDKTSDLPQYKTDSLNGRATIFLPATYGAMLFENAEGLTNDVAGIRTAFWVIGTVNGATGGYVLGGGKSNATGVGTRSFPWARSDAGRFSADSPILDKEISYDYLRWRFNWAMDDAAITIDKTAFGAEQWHVLNTRVQTGQWEGGILTASGFAFDGRVLDAANGWKDFTKYTGRQNLAEVIIYDRRLTDQELAETHAYLQAKWGFKLSAGSLGADVVVAADARVNLGGRQQVRTISGAGTIAGGTLTLNQLTVDGAATTRPTVEGAVALPAGYTLELANIDTTLQDQIIPILNAQSITGDLKAFTLKGESLPKYYRVKLVFQDGVLSARICRRGFLLWVK